MFKISNIVKLKENKNENLHMKEIICYLNTIKDYECKEANKHYICEWLDKIEISINDMEEKTELTNENLPPNKKIGNIATYNYGKINKVL